MEIKLPKISFYKAYIRRSQDSIRWEEDLTKLSEEEPETIHHILEEFITMWNVDGPARIYLTKSYIRKFIWILLWLTCFGYGSYQCYSTFQEYQKFEKNVDVNIVDAEKLEFPAVTICPLNPLTPESSKWFEDNPNWSPFLLMQEKYNRIPYKCHLRNESQTDSSNQSRRKRSLIDEINLLNFMGSSQVVAPKSKRVRRSVGILSAPKTFLNVSDDEKFSIRINCSKTFQRLLYQYNQQIGNVNPPILIVGNTDYCHDLAKYQEMVKVYYDIGCGQPIVMDAYGFYNLQSKDCRTVIITDVTQNKTCGTCCDYCYNGTQFMAMDDSEINGYLGPYFLLKRSVTNDGSDTVNKFAFSTEDIDNSTQPKNKIILTCSFDASTCTDNDFEEWNSYKYGRCYTFNSKFNIKNSKIDSVKNENEVRPTRSFGPKNGLSLTIDLNNKYILDMLSSEIGIRVLIHKPDSMPFPEDEGISISPGVSTSIEVSLNQIQRQIPPWGQCDDIDLGAPYNYSHIACQKICLEQNYRDSCDCYVGMSPAYSHLPMPASNEQCSIFNMNHSICTANILFYFNRGLLNCSCPIPCSEWTYDLAVSSSIPNLKYYEVIQNITQNNLGEDICSGSKNSTVRLRVYLTDSSYQQITENQAYSFETLVANIGASIGLFVGPSIISLLEIFELFLNILLHYVWKRMNKPGKPDAKRALISILHEQTGEPDLRIVNHDKKHMILSSYFFSNENSTENKQ